MGGGATQFGVNEEDLATVLSQPNARCIEGVQVYRGSQMFRTDDLVNNFAEAFRITSLVESLVNHPLRRIVVGGGFGISNDEMQVDLDGISREISPQLNACASRFDVVLELGRFLVASATVFVTTVLNIKNSRGRKFLIVDGGMNNFLRPVLMNDSHPMELVSNAHCKECELVTIVGPLCTPLDVLAKDVQLPIASVGDRILFKNAGAYGFTMSPLLFLSHPIPAVVAIDDGNISLVQRRMDPMSLYRFLLVPPDSKPVGEC